MEFTMKVLKAFEFKAGVGTNATYDWETLLDGKVRQLEAGEDYACKDQTFRMMLVKQGRKRDLGVKANKVEGGLVVQAYKASKEQLEHWAEQDAAAVDKKAAKNGEAE